MTTKDHYSIARPIQMTLPGRVDLFALGFGALHSSLPISHVQDSEDLNHATYLDFKIDRWRIDPAWREIQQDEPMVRVEFLRGVDCEKFLKCLQDNALTEAFKSPGVWVVTMELDGEDVQAVDKATLICLAAAVVQLGGIGVVKNRVDRIEICALREQVEEATEILSRLIV